MKHYPVIVIGAGPAGSTCAYHLARAKLEVLLLEKARMPRLKPCAGGLPEKARELFPFDLSPVLETTVRHAAITLQPRRTVSLHRPEGMGYMVMRDKFDALLVDQAVAQGVQFHSPEKCLLLRAEKNRWRVRTDRAVYSADFVVVADGARSRLAAQLGLMQSFDRYGIALAAELRVSDEQLAAQAERVSFNFHVVPKGYAWIFPKADHLSVGLFTTLPKLKGLRKSLDDFIAQEENSVGFREMVYCRGHLMPRGGVYHRLVTEGALLVGDAAAMLDPFLGEGIYYAAKSGILASRAILQALRENHRRLDSYDRECRQTVVRDLWWARFFNVASYRLPRLTFPLAYHRPFLQNLLVEVIRGKISYRQSVLRAVFGSPCWALPSRPK